MPLPIDLQQIRRIKLVWHHQHRAIGYFQGMGDVVLVIFIIVYEYLLGELTPEKYETVGDEAVRVVESATYTITTFLLDNILSHSPRTEKGVEFHPETLFRTVMRRVDARRPGCMGGDDIYCKQQLYRILVCFFARDLSVQNAAAIYDALICGFAGDAFETFVRMVTGLVVKMADDGVNFQRVETIAVYLQKLFRSTDDETVQALIACVWQM